MTRSSACALRFEGIVKRYDRSSLALDGLSFEVPTGEITGFVGHNGAGKTTAFSLICGFLLPDAGIIDILGRGPFDAHKFKGMLGVLPQDAELPDRHTPHELVHHLACLQGLSSAAAHREAERVLDAVGLTDRAKRPIATLSHGMRRRVAVATALVGRPPLVLLDEPLSGLDPVQAHSLRSVLSELRGEQTLVVSSHDLDDLERLSSWVVMLKSGRCVRQGPTAEITNQGTVVRWELGPGDLPLDCLTSRLPDHRFALDGGVLVHTAPAQGDLDRASLLVMEQLLTAKIAVRSVRRGVGLERRFIEDVTTEEPRD